MGHLYEGHGRVSIEGRRESFTIHAGYGYEPEVKALRELELGGTFYFATAGETGSAGLDAGVRYQLVTKSITGTMHVKPADAVTGGEGHPVPGAQSVVWCYESGRRNQERETDSALGWLWREYPHPEFEIEDLDDLIEALTAYRDKRP